MTKHSEIQCSLDSVFGSTVHKPSLWCTDFVTIIIENNKN